MLFLVSYIFGLMDDSGLPGQSRPSGDDLSCLIKNDTEPFFDDEHTRNLLLRVQILKIFVSEPTF